MRRGSKPASVSPVEAERQDASLADLWRAGFSHGVVVGLAVAVFVIGAALLLAGVL